MKFEDKVDFEEACKQKWKFFDKDIILVQWSRDNDTKEDVIDSIPQWTIIKNIPYALWGEDAINRIFNTLNHPFTTHAIESRHQSSPSLKICVSIHNNFTYLDNVV